MPREASSSTNPGNSRREPSGRLNRKSGKATHAIPDFRPGPSVSPFQGFVDELASLGIGGVVVPGSRAGMGKSGGVRVINPKAVLAVANK